MAKETGQEGRPRKRRRVALRKARRDSPPHASEYEAKSKKRHPDGNEMFRSGEVGFMNEWIMFIVIIRMFE